MAVKRERRELERRLVGSGQWVVETDRTILKAFQLSECVDINCELLDALKNIYSLL